jgi:5'-3' exonuclease
MWPGYKTGEGIEPAQFTLLEDVLLAAGIVVWPMVEFEADDALAAAAVPAARAPRVEQVVILQCMRGTRIVQLNHQKRIPIDEAGVIRKFGVPPRSIPDYLALVGDSADGYPGLSGWGFNIISRNFCILAKYSHLELSPRDWRGWHVNAANSSALAYTLCSHYDRALLFRRLATLQTDIVLFDAVEQLRWNGPTPAFATLGARLDAAITEKK